MRDFFCNLDGNAFWQSIFVSSIFFILSIIVASILIPYLTIRRLKKKNKNYVIRKSSALIQEICEYIIKLPIKSQELNQNHLSIFTKKKDIKNYRFVGLSVINVFDPLVYPKIILKTSYFFEPLSLDDGFKELTTQRNRIKNLRIKLESIIDVHSLHLDDKIISEVSKICLDIRSFEIKFEHNNLLDDLYKSGKAKRTGLFGVLEFGLTLEKVLKLLKFLINKEYFDIEIEPST